MHASVASFVAVSALEGLDGLFLDATKLHLFLKLMHVANTWEKVRLSPNVVEIQGREPLIPLLLWRLGLFEIANDGKLERRKETWQK